MTDAADDRRWMELALRLARAAVGDTAENPPVGCVLVRGGRVVGRGRTAAGGRPHAEAVALAQAGAAERGATAYVTLEPCAHHGRTPPCAEALVAAGVARVVAAVGDPDPRVDGGGFEILRRAGIAVTVGVGEQAAARAAEGFLARVAAGRPHVTLKLATSLDGRIATASGASRWITGAAARAHAHAMRARQDAILVGIGTALADDPALTCRAPGLAGRSPVRVVLDSSLRLSPDSSLVRTARAAPTWVVTCTDHDGGRAAALVARGVEVIAAEPDGTGRPAIAAALVALAGRGIGRLLVEGGAGVARSVVAAGLVDEIAWYRAPMLLGGDGLAAVDPLRAATPADAPRFERQGCTVLGEDVLETYRRRP
ncbi:riboflavin biosynthesis protein RibD [Thalassobaculum fulvum]|uniref:Riboflavin biosynthesis protein RibD n=1 Tax=Thalassobaculum fulvum TaxID=1633335 RepID=A0A918XQM0_9PROT|nr:bifunctional diaminohydroxyphosphoribosylaminopyrimidine deaminase/5-amino-6-(5-phosphoribosylamino)uracil reductase RibD [Thalassobaculum fulvum]GHD47640.1 riboflavin biosynthesis protein RibD [Thalassobaculum fulvum]